MKIITRYIFKEHLSPFFGALFVIMFIFLLQFLAKYIGQIFGKGLSIITILELIFLNLAWMMALAVPMSTLLAVLMAYGRFSEDNEITILKSSGISLYKTIKPSLIFGLIITLFMLYFNDQVLPNANHEARKMFKSIKRKKPTLALEEHIFYEMANFSFVVDKIEKPLLDEWLDLVNSLGPEYQDQKTLDRLKNVTIFDRSNPNITKTINAEEGFMVYSKEKRALIFTLFNGEFHELDFTKIEDYQRSEFEKNVVYIPARDFELEETNSNYRSDREMNIAQMQEEVDKNQKNVQEQINKTVAIVEKNFAVLNNLFSLIENDTTNKLATINSFPEDMEEVKRISRHKAIRAADRYAQKIKTNSSILSNYNKNINKFEVEIYKKLSIPFSSLMFVLVGAPLGIMARKGSIGIAVLLSLGFFVMYWAFLIGGEKMADRQLVSPFWAMWSPNFIMLVVGSYLTWRAMRESSFINWGQIIGFFNRLGKNKQT